MIIIIGIRDPRHSKVGYEADIFFKLHMPKMNEGRFPLFPSCLAVNVFLYETYAALLPPNCARTAPLGHLRQHI